MNQSAITGHSVRISTEVTKVYIFCAKIHMRLLELFSHTVLRGGLENIYFFYQHNWRKSDTNTIGHLAVEQMVSLVH